MKEVSKNETAFRSYKKNDGVGECDAKNCRCVYRLHRWHVQKLDDTG